MQASGSLLAQLRPSVTTDVTAFTAAVPTEITAVYVANVDTTAHAFRLYHDVGGTTYAIDNALYYDLSVPANDTFVLRTSVENSGLMLAAGDSIGVATDAANDLVFTLYGISFSAVGTTTGVT